MEEILDNVKVNFDEQALWTLNIALAFVMFGVALEIKPSDFKRILLEPKLLLTGILSQFIALPFLTFILVWIIRPIPSVALGMIMVAACPGGNISNFITHLAKGNSALSVSLTAFATLLAIFFTPLNLQFWGGLYEPTQLILQNVAIEPWQMVKLVALLLAVPLILGIICNTYFPIRSKKLSKFFKIASLLFFIILIGLALGKNKLVFLEYVPYVFWLVLLHNCIALITGFSLSKLMGLNMEDTKSITIETGIQNSGLGLLLIFTFFEGLGGMALIAAFWGIWHLVSGLVLGSIWSRMRSTKKKVLNG